MDSSLAAVASRYSCEPLTRVVKRCSNPKKIKGTERKRKIKTDHLRLCKMKTR